VPSNGIWPAGTRHKDWYSKPKPGVLVSNRKLFYEIGSSLINALYLFDLNRLTSDSQASGIKRFDRILATFSKPAEERFCDFFDKIMITATR
jgi:hypothetical protein